MFCACGVQTHVPPPWWRCGAPPRPLTNSNVFHGSCATCEGRHVRLYNRACGEQAIALIDGEIGATAPTSESAAQTVWRLSTQAGQIVSFHDPSVRLTANSKLQWTFEEVANTHKIFYKMTVDGEHYLALRSKKLAVIRRSDMSEDDASSMWRIISAQFDAPHVRAR